MSEKLKNIIADGCDELAEYTVKAILCGYADGIKMGYDQAKDGELCDSFIRVWNDRAELIDRVADTRLSDFAEGWLRGRAKVGEHERYAWCDGFIAGWNGQAGAEPESTITYSASDDTPMCIDCRYRVTDTSRYEMGDFCTITEDNIVNLYDTCERGERK